jgi:hypothetical protein
MHLTGSCHVCAKRCRQGSVLLVTAINWLGWAEIESEVRSGRKESERACYRVSGARASSCYPVLQPALVSEWSLVESATPCMTGGVELRHCVTKRLPQTKNWSIVRSHNTAAREIQTERDKFVVNCSEYKVMRMSIEVIHLTRWMSVKWAPMASDIESAC